MATKSGYDLVVIGAGPGGYTAALRAAELGLRTAIVERCSQLGGTCLRIGCIPSKALLSWTEAYVFARDRLRGSGIASKGFEVDPTGMHARKEAIVEKLAGGIAFLLRQRGVEVVEGVARITGPQTVAVRQADREEILQGRAILLASGSEPVELPFLPFDRHRVVDSTGALSFPEAPRSLLVIGAGAVGLELGSVWSRLGTEVLVVELLPRIAAGFSPMVSKALQHELEKQKIRFLLGARVTRAEVDEGGVALRVESGGAEQTLVAERVLVAVGRRPCHTDLGLAEAGIGLTPSGRVAVNRLWQTSVPSIYAIGDLIEGPMLAHRAQAEGRVVAELLAGMASRMHYLGIPNVIYTEPEAASVGFSEEELRAADRPYRRGTAYFGANGRALAAEAPEGFVTVLMEERSGKFAGMEIVGSRASELIGIGALALETGASVECLARMIQPHPTFQETVKEAALAALRVRRSKSS
ncbi:dihydrolipoamide dehydrogenase [Methylacidimicrobium cyclopophantes]|uniref:Dihydrolipoyl dehydrogenase n=1 Tax=Methylacidimicrobium cyclopophantes TaxID=1041766 RepID=A0A5E6M531_9BACT|nr:dihydrolipoyl dehydrogenase [Methylacidimicrobium cyclopophantes]VVM04682.1 dihydrolipoamide dehydrogenase [Methylacidimicrobium cyclopophantes]